MNPNHHDEAAKGAPEAKKVPFRVCVTFEAYINVSVDAMDEIEAEQAVDDEFICEQINTLTYNNIEILSSRVEFVEPA